MIKSKIMEKDLTTSQMDRQNILTKEIKILLVLFFKKRIILENLQMY